MPVFLFSFPTRSFMRHASFPDAFSLAFLVISRAMKCVHFSFLLCETIAACSSIFLCVALSFKNIQIKWDDGLMSWDVQKAKGNRDAGVWHVSWMRACSPVISFKSICSNRRYIIIIIIITKERERERILLDSPPPLKTATESSFLNETAPTPQSYEKRVESCVERCKGGLVELGFDSVWSG